MREVFQFQVFSEKFAECYFYLFIYLIIFFIFTSVADKVCLYNQNEMTKLRPKLKKKKKRNKLNKIRMIKYGCVLRVKSNIML